MAVDRATFVATEVDWRRQVGDVRINHHEAKNGFPAFDYMTLSRTCSPEAAEDVGMQILKLALVTNAYLVAHVEMGYVAFSVAVSCEDVGGVVVDEIPTEMTERVPEVTP